jgi:hypothetical protein
MSFRFDPSDRVTGELAVAMLDGKQVKIAARRRPDEVETWGR